MPRQCELKWWLVLPCRREATHLVVYRRPDHLLHPDHIRLVPATTSTLCCHRHSARYRRRIQLTLAQAKKWHARVVWVIRQIEAFHDVFNCHTIRRLRP